MAAERRPARPGSPAARADGSEGVDAYFGIRREHMRWLTGFTLDEGEDKVAGHSGQFLVGPDDVVVLTDSRYTIQARREAPDAAVDEIGYDLPAPGAPAGAVGARRVAVEAASCRTPCGCASPRRRPTSSSCRSTAGSRRCARQDARARSSGSPPPVPSPTARSPRSCRDPAGVTEHDLALRLEWLMRTGGAEALAFDVAVPRRRPRPRCRTARPGDRPVIAGEVLLFDFGAQVEGYRSDMTRTLFVGEPRRVTSRSTSSSRARSRRASTRSRRASRPRGAAG